MNNIEEKIYEIKLQILDYLIKNDKIGAVRHARSSLSLDLEFAMKFVKQVEKEITPDK